MHVGFSVFLVVNGSLYFRSQWKCIRMVNWMEEIPAAQLPLSLFSKRACKALLGFYLPFNVLGDSDRQLESDPSLRCDR
jgi:hypothetical protein